MSAGHIVEIFEREITRRRLNWNPQLLPELIEKRYKPEKRPFRRCHARDLLNRAEDLMAFERRDRVLTSEIVNNAYDACFVNEEGWEAEMAATHE